jgi:hypothetical protein
VELRFLLKKKEPSKRTFHSDKMKQIVAGARERVGELLSGNDSNNY